MNRSSLVSLTVVALLVVSVFGCKPDAANNAGKAGKHAKKKLVIAAIPKATGGEFWETVEQGARDAAKELDVDLKWEGTLTETEIAEQKQ